MNLLDIKEKLNAMFHNDNRTLVFWYDDDAEFQTEVNNLELDNAVVHQISDYNLLETKYMIEKEKASENFLVYAPFPRPEDRYNHLADIIHYSRIFNADMVSIVMTDLHIPTKYREHIATYLQFFVQAKHERSEKYAAKRYEGFKELGIENYSEDLIDEGMISVIVGLDTPNFDEVVKTVILEGDFKENKWIISFEKLGLLPLYWKLVKNYYGYPKDEETPTIEKFTMALFVTYLKKQYRGELPKKWRMHETSRVNDVSVFMNNIMHNVNCKVPFNTLSERIEHMLNVKEYVEEMEIELYKACDCFSIFDEKVIDTYTAIMISTRLELHKEQLDIIEYRKSKGHFAERYIQYYEVLTRASALLNQISKVRDQIHGNADKLIKMYEDAWYKIDMDYRKFYVAYDAIHVNKRLKELRDMMELLYTNTYLAKTSSAFTDKVMEMDTWNDMGYLKQYQFYDKVVQGEINRKKTVVIISDALRYECGVELMDILNENAQYDADLSLMISNVPAYTKLGMASLLPHKSISYNDKWNVIVDGIDASTFDARGKVLKLYNEGNAAVDWNKLKPLQKDETMKLVKGSKNVIYIYHNRIDNMGEGNEYDTLEACETALAEIGNIITHMVNRGMVERFIITADHGFIYRRDNLEESDKLGIPDLKDAFKDRRFVLSKDSKKIEGLLQYDLGYINQGLEGVHVAIPMGADVFKCSGGANYAHGGASLQEVLIPIIKLDVNRKFVVRKRVEIELLSISRKITNNVAMLEFMQKEAVSDTKLAATYAIYFEDEAGNRISTENLINADSKSDLLKDRQYKEKFTLKAGDYRKDKTYYLILMDVTEESEKIEIERYKYVIDIMFERDEF